MADDFRIADERREQELNDVELNARLREDRIQRERMIEREAEIAAVEQAAQSQVHFRTDVGKFITPEESTLQGHLDLVKDESKRLRFSPVRYPLFDGIIAKAFLDPRFNHEHHPRYRDFEGLRTNIAAVRNYVLSQLFPDGSFDPEDQPKAQFVAEMAREIGVALQRDTIFKMPFTDSLDQKLANIEGPGAAEIYKLLIKIQERRVTLKKPWLILGFGKNRHWGLPPFEECPFCPENTAPVQQTQDPSDSTDEASDTVYTMPEEDQFRSASQEMADIADNIELREEYFQPVSGLDKPVLDESVELARKILEHLKAQFGDQSARDWLSQEADQLKPQADALAQVSTIYATRLMLAKQVLPMLAQNPAIMVADQALGQLTYMTRLAAMKHLPEENPANAARVAAQLKNTPEPFKQINDVKMKELIERIEVGLHQAEQAMLAAEQTGNDLYQMSLWNNSRGQQTVAPSFVPQKNKAEKALMEIMMDDQAIAAAQQKKAMREQRHERTAQQRPQQPSIAAAMGAGMIASGLSGISGATRQSTIESGIDASGKTSKPTIQAPKSFRKQDSATGQAPQQQQNIRNQQMQQMQQVQQKLTKPENAKLGKSSQSPVSTNIRGKIPTNLADQLCKKDLANLLKYDPVLMCKSNTGGLAPTVKSAISPAELAQQQNQQNPANKQR